jgi:hypothetical protein
MTTIALTFLLGAIAGANPATATDDSGFSDLVGADVTVTYKPASRAIVGTAKTPDNEFETVTGTLLRVTKDNVVVTVAGHETAIARATVWSITRKTAEPPTATNASPERHAPSTESPQVPSKYWDAMMNRDVVLTYASGKHLHGKLVAADDDSATLVKKDGKIVTAVKAEVVELSADVERVAPVRSTDRELDVADTVDRVQARQELRADEDALEQAKGIAWIGPVLTVGGILTTIGGGGAAALGVYLGREDIAYVGAAFGAGGVSALLGGLVYWWFNGASQGQLEDQINKARVRAASVDASPPPFALLDSGRPPSPEPPRNAPSDPLSLSPRRVDVSGVEGTDESAVASGTAHR